MSGPFPNQPGPAPAQVPTVPTASNGLPSMVLPPDQLSGAQLPAQDWTPQPAQAQQQRLLAGKYQTPEELERAYNELQQAYGLKGQENGLLRDQYYAMMQQQIAAQQTPPAQPAAPAAPQQTEEERIYAMLKPLVEQQVRASGGDVDDEAAQNAAWEQVYGIYSLINAMVAPAVESRVAPIMQQTQAAQQQVVQQSLAGRVQQVMGSGAYQTLNPQQLYEMAQSLPAEQLAKMTPEQQLEYVYTIADAAENRNRRMGVQPGQTQGFPPQTMPQQPTMFQPMQPGFQPAQPQQPIYPPVSQPPQSWIPPGMQPPAPQYIPPGQVPNTLAPQGQTPPSMDPQLAYYTQHYQQTMGLPPDRALRAAQATVAQLQRGQQPARGW